MRCWRGSREHRAMLGPRRYDMSRKHFVTAGTSTPGHSSDDAGSCQRKGNCPRSLASHLALRSWRSSPTQRKGCEREICGWKLDFGDVVGWQLEIGYLS